MTKQEYNGWTNYETWNCKLWIDNDERMQEYWEGEAKEYARMEDDKETAIGLLADMLQTHYEETSPEVTGFYADILNAALREVNWHEIASSIIDDLEIDCPSQSED